MKKIIVITLLFLSFFEVSNAQSTFDKLLFEEAQEAYTKQNYKYCLQKIEELNQRGVKGLLVLHLKIVATDKIAEAHLNDEMIIQFKKDVAYYLKNYDNEDFINQYKDIYEISKTLNAPKWDEAKYCINRGEYLYKNKYFKEALDWYLKAVQYGSKNDKLFYQIGYLYNFGTGAEKDAKKAFQYFLKAAEMGNIKAQGELVRMYSYGSGTDINIDEAINWSDKLMAQGNFWHLWFDLIMKLLDKKDAKNYKPEKAIAQNNKVLIHPKADVEAKMHAHISLGQIYSKHITNYPKAFEHFYTIATTENYDPKAYDRAFPLIQFLLESSNTEVSDLFIDKSKDIINILESLLKNPQRNPNGYWDKEIIFSQLTLSGLYTLDMNGLKPNQERSNYWFDEVINNDYIKTDKQIWGQTYYVLIFYGLAKTDFDRVVKLYEIDIYKYKDDSWNMAKFNLALYNYEGLGTSQDYKKAFELFSSQNYLSNEFVTAMMYYHGKGVKKDIQKAKQICENIDISENPDFYKTQYKSLNGEYDKLRVEFFPELNSDVLAFLDFLEKEIDVKYKD